MSHRAQPCQRCAALLSKQIEATDQAVVSLIGVSGLDNREVDGVFLLFISYMIETLTQTAPIF